MIPTLPCRISPGAVPGTLSYCVEIEDQQASAHATGDDLWFANGVKVGELAGSIGETEGYVGVRLDSPPDGPLVSVVLPEGCRLVVRCASLRLLRDAD